MRVGVKQFIASEVLSIMILIISGDGAIQNITSELPSPPSKNDFNAEWKWRQSGMLPTIMSFGEAVILAREEAKCLRDFGKEIEVVNRNYSSFMCSPASSSYILCNQCTNLAKRKRNQQDCKNYCTNDTDGTCLTHCIRINQSVMSESKEIESRFNNTDLNIKISLSDNAQFLERNKTELEYVPVDSKRISLFGSTNTTSDDKVDKLIQSQQVFCEGVSYVENHINYSSVPYATRLNPANEVEQLGQNHFILLMWKIRAPSNHDKINPTGLKTRSDEGIRRNYKGNHRHNSITIKQRVRDNFNKSSMEPNNTPLVFVIQSSSQKHPQWKTVAKTVHVLQTVDVAYGCDTYRWRITAVGPVGIVDEVVTDNYTTLDGYITPGPPTKIDVFETVTHENSTDVLIGWEPAKENACFYKVVLQSYEGDEHPKQIRIKEDPLGVNQCWFKNLRFGAQYSVRITTRDPTWNAYESSLTELIFKTPTCLQSHNNEFDKCEPPPPRNITARIIERKTSGHTLVVFVRLQWKPPKYASISNQVEKYVVEVKSMNVLPNHQSYQNSSINSFSTKSTYLKYISTAVVEPIAVPGVRVTYWPTLGLTDRKNKYLTGTLSSTNTYGDNRKTSCSSPITYADINGFSFHNSSASVKGLDRIYGFCSLLNFTDGYTTKSGVRKQSQHSPLMGNFSCMDSLSVDSESEECRPIDEKDILSYARQVAMGMEYLERNRVVHRDLACRNVLLLGNYKELKISDFGLSRDVYTWNTYHQKSNEKLPVKWMAIESVFTHIFTSKSDVWSFGVLIWELVTLGGTPYPGLANNELFSLLKSGYRMGRPDNCSEELYALIKKCWRTDSASRPNFSELREHLERMMNSAEPNLYLTLMEDVPSDYFRLSSRIDLLDHRKKDNINSTKDTQGSCANRNGRRQYAHSYQGVTLGERSRDHSFESKHIKRRCSENADINKRTSKEINISGNQNPTLSSVTLYSQSLERISTDLKIHNSPKMSTSTDFEVQPSETEGIGVQEEFNYTCDDGVVESEV